MRISRPHRPSEYRVAVSRTAFRDDVGPGRPSRRAGARAGAAALFALATIACGALAEEPERPTLLTTLTVQVSLPPTAKNPRVALAWRSVDGALFETSDDVRVEPGQRGGVSLPIRRAPPLKAIHRVEVAEGESTAFVYAVGALVAYDDAHENLEYSGDDPPLAASRTVYVVWLERPPSAAEARLLADGAGRVPAAGLNFQRLSATGSRWVSPSEPYPLLDTASKDSPLALPARVCSPLYGPVPDSPPAVYDLKTTFPPSGAPALSCLSAGREVRISPCVAEGLCASELACQSYGRTLAPTEGIPPGWPCPVE